MQFELVDVGERASWGARPPRRPWRPFSKPPRLVVFHHTVSGIGRVLGPEEEAFLQREMQRHHMNLGWGDIGQHFTVFKSGRILEGRPLGAVGVHAAGANSYTIGIEHQGNFEVEEPTEAQLEASARLIASLYRHFSWPDDGGERLRPHREFSRTACPGRYGMVSLDHVRSIVSRLVSVSGGTEKSMRYPFQLEKNGAWRGHVFVGDGRSIWLHLYTLDRPGRVHLALYRWGTKPFEPANAAWRSWLDVSWGLSVEVSRLVPRGEYLMDVFAPQESATIYGDVEEIVR